MTAPRNLKRRSSFTRTWRISRQRKEQALFGLVVLLVGLWFGGVSYKLKAYQPVGSSSSQPWRGPTTPVTALQQIRPPKKPKSTHPQHKKGDLLHVIKTRFFQYQPDSPSLVQARVQVFQTFVLPAMVNQTNRNFFWIVSVEQDLPPIYIDQLVTMLEPYPHFLLTNVMMDQKQDGGRDLLTSLQQQEQPPPTNGSNNQTLPFWKGDTDLLYYHLAVERTTVPFLETRIDSDDALHLTFVEHVQAKARQTFLLDDNKKKEKQNQIQQQQQQLVPPDWMYWCVNRAMHFKWFGPGGTNKTTYIEKGAFLETGLDPDVCAIPGLTVGFRASTGDENDNLFNTFFRTRAILLQEELASKRPWCGAMTSGPACLQVLGNDSNENNNAAAPWEYPILRIETPATPATEKPDKKSKNETERVLQNGAWDLGKTHFSIDAAHLEILDRLIRKIPPYYMYPPRVDRSIDRQVAAGIAAIDPSQWLKLPGPQTYPGDYGRDNRQILHIVKTRFMQHQPHLVELAKARVELFKAFCLPSVIHQTSQNFFWLIYTDPELDKVIVDEMVKLLEPYPHYYLVSSNIAKRGLGGKDISHGLTPANFHTGNTKRLFKNLNNTHFLNVLESRLDADDAINLNWIEEVQRRASVMFQEENGRDWMWWCINRAVEWNWVGPGERKPLQQYGALVFPRPYDERNFCHTPGMTLGLRRGTHTRTVKKESHHLLYEALERDNDPCGPPDTYSGTDCIAFITNFTFAALRSRTHTSASMASVNTNGGKAYREAAEQAVERWTDVSQIFALSPSEVKKVNRYFFKHMKPIVMDNIKGQCTEGHSCRVEAEESLNKMLQLYSMNEEDE